MKKVLFGLLALSSISMAAAVDLGATPTTGTPVFQTNQQGAVEVKGTFTSTIPVIKYVVYASGDNGTTKNDVLALPNFILSQDAAKAGFASTPEKVYVKRVTGSPGSEVASNLEVSDNVIFNVKLDSYYSNAAYKRDIKNGSGSVELPPTALLTKNILDDIGATLGDSKVHTTTSGTIASTTSHYMVPKHVYISSAENGVLTFGLVNETWGSLKFSPEASAAVETAFAGGKAISNAKILVKVD